MFPLLTFAQTTDSTADLQALIKQLQTQIQSLQSQIADLQIEVQTVKIELKFSRALAQGATGDDVKKLQEFLKNFTGSYPNGLITGYYGPLTQVAVKKFQEQNGIESVGMVGPKTQEKLNVLVAAIPATPATPSSGTGIPATSATSATPAISTTPITSISNFSSTTPATPCKTPVGVQIPFTPTVIKILSPNGGEQWQVGETYTIKYSAKDIVGNKALLVYLNKGYDAPTTKTGVNSSQLIGVTTNLESYTYTIPSNIQSWPGLGNNYTISIYVEGSYASCDVISYIGDFSDTEFSIIAGQNNTQVTTPTISVSSPVTTTSGGGYGTIVTTSATQDKIANIQTQISILQNQLNNTIDTATRDSLIAQIIALKTQVKILQGASDTTTTVISATSINTNGLGLHSQSQTPVISASSTNQEKINALLMQISALYYKLNNTTDTATRDYLTTQITTLEAQVQAIRDKINAISKQISVLQNQLNNTIDTATRDSLITQIVALKAQMQ